MLSSILRQTDNPKQAAKLINEITASLCGQSHPKINNQTIAYIDVLSANLTSQACSVIALLFLKTHSSSLLRIK